MEWGAIVEARGTEGKEVLSGARDGFAEYFDFEVAARGVKLDTKVAVSIDVFSNNWKMHHHGSHLTREFGIRRIGAIEALQLRGNTWD